MGRYAGPSFLGLMLLWSGGAHAQNTPIAPATPAAAPLSGEGQSSVTDDIVVTASRREERLQDVPISVTAVTGAQLARKQVVDIVTLSKIVPGLQSKQTLSPLEITSSIRGITQLVPNLTIDPPIGTYVDGVYTALNAGSNLALIDMERVEVLKGPQGTLFGRNTIGGAISITTAQPTNEFEGYVQGSLGNYHAAELTGVVNVPLVSDALALRMVYQHSEHDGYGRNLTTGNPTATLNQDYMRGSLRWRASDSITAVLTGYYVASHGYAAATRLIFVDPTVALAPGLPPVNAFYPAISGKPGDLLSNYIGRGGFYDSNGDLDNSFRLKQYGFTGTITAQLSDQISLHSISAYTHTRYNSITDVDGTPYSLLQLAQSPIRAKQFSEELQLLGTAIDGRLSFITGVYVFGIDGSQYRNSQVLSALVGTVNVGGPIVRNRSYSAFGQVTFSLTDKLKMTGGARYTRDTRRANYTQQTIGLATGQFQFCQLANAPFSTSQASCSFLASDHFIYVPWTVGVDYHLDEDKLIYAKISRGFRSGAFAENGPSAIGPSANVTSAQAAIANLNRTANFAAAGPENVLSPEIGAKLVLLDRALRVNMAAYYSDYKDIQLSVNGLVDPGCSSCALPNVLVNVGKAHVWGGEFEATAKLGVLQFDLGLGYTHPKYVSGPYVGTPVINVSKFNGSFTATAPVETRIGTLSFSGTYSYRSKALFYTLAPGLPASVQNQITQKGFGLLDARVDLKIANRPITVSAFVSNLTGKKYFTSASDFAPPIAFAQIFPGTPRIGGASLRFDF